MRKRGVPETKITGDASNREKWTALAEVFPDLAGNPTYEWVHLDLKRRFGIEKTINAETADGSGRRRKHSYSPTRCGPNRSSGTWTWRCCAAATTRPTGWSTTNAPKTRSRAWTSVPTWRPDRALKIETDAWGAFVDELDEVTEGDVSDLVGFRAALRETHDYFADHGCVACDVGTRTDPVSRPVSGDRAADIYDRAQRGENLAEREVRDWKAYTLEFVGELNAEREWVTQLHIGAVRSYRQSLFDELGPNAGGDVSTQDVDVVEGLDYFLDRFDGEFEVVCYVLDPSHYYSVGTVARAYPNVSIGPAWWFNDSPYGMEDRFGVRRLRRPAGQPRRDGERLPEAGLLRVALRDVPADARQRRRPDGRTRTDPREQRRAAGRARRLRPASGTVRLLSRVNRRLTRPGACALHHPSRADGYTFAVGRDSRIWQSRTTSQRSPNGTGRNWSRDARVAMIGLGWWTMEEAMPAVEDSTFCERRRWSSAEARTRPPACATRTSLSRSH